MLGRSTEQTYRLGRRPAKQGPRHQLSDRGWVDKSATERNNKLKPVNEMLSVGTWNVRTLWAAGKLDLLEAEMARYRCDILGISEMRWTKAGETKGGRVIWSGEPDKHEAGVGFLLNKKAKAALMGYKPVSSRMMVARFGGQPFNITIIQVYAPTSESTDEEIEDFYTKLTELVEEVPVKDVLIMSGDWNAKVGSNREGWENVMGRFGFGDRNARGERLLEFATDNDMTVCNTRFQQKDCRKWTWRSCDGRTKNMIDLILIKRRWTTAVQQCRTFQGADMDSDHSLVIANIKLKLKRKHKATSQKRRDISRLNDRDIAMIYQQELAKKLEKFDHEQDLDLDKRVERLTSAIQEAVRKVLPEEEKIKKKWITQQTLKLVQEKRVLKFKRDQSDSAEQQYKAKCNEVRIASRLDKARWLEQQCEDIERYHGECRTREVYKLIKNINKKWQPRLTAIKDDNGTVLMEKSQILQRWTKYCSALYEEQLDHDTAAETIKELEAISPPVVTSEDDIMEEEVRKAIKRLKNNKSPGIDNISGEMLKQGGEVVVQELHKICNMAWAQGRAPEQWKKAILVTLHKTGCALECSNYRTIALISHLSKVLMMILAERLTGQTEEYLADEQAGFRKDRSTVQQILALRLIAEKARRKKKKIYNCFVDFQKAFDSIDQNVTWAVLGSYGVDDRLVRLLKDINGTAMAAVRVGDEVGPWIRTSRGTRQGDPISPKVFITHLERAMDKIKTTETGVSIQGMQINNLRFADDIDVIEESERQLQETVQVLNDESKRYGLKMNFNKTKTMVFGDTTMEQEICIDGIQLENVEDFTYLGSKMTHDLDCKSEIKVRTAKGMTALKALDKVWKSKSISLRTKISVLNTCVFSSMLYGCETWVHTKETQRRVLAFERKCYRKVLGITWQQKVTNEEVYARVSVKENIMQKIIQRKLRLFGHICRMKDDRKIKTLMFGTMAGNNKRGRPHKEWIDDIVEWCGKNLQELRWAALDRQLWFRIVKKASDTYGK